MSKGNFAKAAGIMVVAVFLSRILGLVRESVIAAQLGQGEMAGIYKMAFRLPDLLYFLIAGGALSSAFVPVFTEYLSTGREKEAWKIYSVIASVMGIVIGVFIVIGLIFTRQLVPLIAWGFNDAQLDQTAHLTRILLPAQWCFFIGGLTMGTLYARRQFLIPSLGPIVYNVGIIIAGIWLIPRMGADGLAWGALAGALFGNLLLQLWYSARLGVDFKFSLDTSHPGVRKVFMLMLPVILGLGLPQIDVLINQSFATLISAKAVAAIDNANRLMQVPLGIFGQAAGIAALPALSTYFAQKDWDSYKDTLSFGVRSVFFATIPSAAFMIVLSRPMISLVLEAGKFTHADTVYAAQALVWYSLGVFAWGGQAVMARGFYAMQDTVTPVVIGTIMTIIFVPLNWILMKAMGHSGLALATSIMAILYLVALSAVLAKKVNGIGAWRILTSTAKITAASGVAAGAAYGVSIMPMVTARAESVASVKLCAALQLLPALFVGSVAYIACCHLLKVEESRYFYMMIARRFSKSSGEAAA
ncbi:MAG: murein biosynthesis integral membrane protein MurJ [Armatimonadota bacterium]